MKKIRMVKLSLVLSLVMFFSMFQGVVASAQQYYDEKRAEGYRELDVLGKGMEMVMPGDVVTLTATVLEEHEPYYLGFRRWTFIEQDGIVCDNPPVADGEKNMVGLGADELSQMTISFVMPDKDIKAYYDYYIDTVSGNKAWLGHWPVDMQYLRDKVDIDVSIDDGGAGGGSSSDSNNTQETGNNNIVRKSDGTIIAGAQVPMYYAARTITGVAVATSKEEVDKAAGLSEEDIQAGTNAKFYIGDVYKGYDKEMLQGMVESINGTLISMLDIDLYTIEKNGRINWVAFSDDPIRLTMGIPASKQFQGGRYCLLASTYTYTNNGMKTEKMVMLEDKDDDIATITVDLSNVVGHYAIVYMPD